MDNTSKTNQEINISENKQLDYLTLQEKLEELWEKEKELLKKLNIDPGSK